MALTTSQKALIARNPLRIYDPYHTDREIYVMTCSATGKKYVGQTGNIEYRFRTHLNGDGKLGYYDDLKKYGKGAFTIERIDQTIFPFLADVLEYKYTIEYDCIENGYNRKAIVCSKSRRLFKLICELGPEEFCKKVGLEPYITHKEDFTRFDRIDSDPILGPLKQGIYKPINPPHPPAPHNFVKFPH